MVTVKQHAQFVEVLLQPNRSATWVQTCQMIMALSGFMLAIGIGWLIMGSVQMGSDIRDLGSLFVVPYIVGSSLFTC